MSRRWFPGSLRSRPLPAFGRTPPFHCRFTGEKSASLAPPPGLRPYSPVPLPFHGALLCQLGGVEGSPDPSDDVAFGGPDGFFLGFAFAHAAGDVGSCFSSGFELGSDDQVDHLVGLSVAAPVEPVSLLTARRGV